MRQAHIHAAVAALAASAMAEPDVSEQARKTITALPQPMLQMSNGTSEGNPPASIRFRRKGKKAWKATRRIRG